MTKKDIAFLLSPILFFLVIGIGLFSSAGLLQMRVNTGASSEKFDTFVQNVKSGKWQPTTNQWLDLMQGERTVVASNLKSDSSLREVLLTLVLFCLIGLLCQVAVVLHFRKKAKVRNE